MHLKRYTFFSIILIALIGILVYTQIDAKYTLDIFGIPVSLPVAVWIVLPMVLLYFASIFHMAYYSFKGYIKGKKYKKDYENIVKSLFNAILREPKLQSYKTQEFRNIGSITDRSNILLKEYNFDIKDDILRKAVQYVKDIERGEYIDIKDIKFSKDNPLYLKNLENRINEEMTYSGVILNKCNEFPEELCKKALNRFLDYGEITKIKDYSKIFDFENLYKLLEMAKDEERKLNLNTTDLIYIIQESKLKFTPKEYINLAKNIKDIFMPDERLKFFELLKNSDEKAEAGYIYTLLDLEMIEKAKDELENSEENEFLNFKAFLELKECGRNYPLDLFA
ncbi:hypothetical protein [Nitrosophilus kaiyonis]|uniref:hypothetical protein n=1 Tax=Nitrosophilus kaiyonis TaxID=2930200 RepID=UPI002490EF86|nr:hypothetical protein [Nitrosophilus kaiyonis]